MPRFASILTAVVATAGRLAAAADPASSTTCNGKSYTYNELAGYGFVPGDARDKLGDTISLGSSIAISSWKKLSADKYEGQMYGLPDRGWNTQGTQNYQARIHKFMVTLTLNPGASAGSPGAPNVAFVYNDTILLSGPDGKPTTGLDPDQVGGLTYPGFPILPAATYPGDGFGGSGPGDKRISVDAEALVLAENGGFWVSDEYGPHVYKFDKTGKMIAAIAPPDALRPLRNGSVSFSSDNPPVYDTNKHPSPVDPTQGRQNNQGFEGMSISPNGKNLFVLLQSAARQEGGSSSSTRKYTRLLRYTIKGGCPAGHNHPFKPNVDPAPVLSGEWVVPLPTFKNAEDKTRIAAQSEMKFISDTQFFFLPRDSSVGRNTADSLSRYRHVDIFDISAATNVNTPSYNAFNASIASSAGVLNPEITAATVCPFLDINMNAQLNRFGLHNGGAQDAGLLNEKWEGLALVPVNNDLEKKRDDKDEYFLFVASDNDFITQNGFINGGAIPYHDASGGNLDNQMLVFKITLPAGSKPLVG